jgi:hypothetical protein
MNGNAVEVSHNYWDAPVRSSRRGALLKCRRCLREEANVGTPVQAMCVRRSQCLTAYTEYTRLD